MYGSPALLEDSVMNSISVYVVYYKGVPISVWRSDQKEDLLKRFRDMRRAGFEVSVHRANVLLESDQEFK